MPKPRAPFSEDIVDRILEGLWEGRGLRRICREPGMPTRATILRWQAGRPEFAELATAARRMGGLLDAPGRPCGLRPRIADEIYLRLSHGEPLRTICRDPHLPSRSTVQAWAQRHPDLADLLDLGRDNAQWTHADANLGALGRPTPARAVTPKDPAESARQPKRPRKA